MTKAADTSRDAICPPPTQKVTQCSQGWPNIGPVHVYLVLNLVALPDPWLAVTSIERPFHFSWHFSLSFPMDSPIWHVGKHFYLVSHLGNFAGRRGFLTRWKSLVLLYITFFAFFHGNLRSASFMRTILPLVYLEFFLCPVSNLVLASATSLQHFILT